MIIESENNFTISSICRSHFSFFFFFFPDSFMSQISERTSLWLNIFRDSFMVLMCAINISWSLLKLIELVMPSNHLILCHPLLLLPSIFPSIRIFSNESVLLIRGPKYWSFSPSISPSNEHSGLIAFRIDCHNLLAVKGTLKTLLQHHSSKASILQHSAFFMDQLSHPYLTTGKTIALTRWIFTNKIMSLLLNKLSRIVIAFLQRSKHLLISWLQSPSAVILEPFKKIKFLTVSTVSPSIFHEVMGLEP